MYLKKICDVLILLLTGQVLHNIAYWQDYYFTTYLRAAISSIVSRVW